MLENQHDGVCVCVHALLGAEGNATETKITCLVKIYKGQQLFYVLV